MRKLENSKIMPDYQIICGIVVLYRPQTQMINHIINLLESVDHIVVVINGSANLDLNCIQNNKDITTLYNKDNIGLAAGLNQGIDYALKKKQADYVLLLDQDSKVSSDMPRMLMEHLRRAEKLGMAPACIGPVLIDERMPSAKVANLLYSDSGLIEVAAIATSGTLISRTSYMAIGPMLEKLFIDSIDYEWCFRAKSQGYRIFIAQNQRMLHNMGDKGINILGKFKPIHQSPIRHYYIIRNSLFMLKLSYVPIGWKFFEFFKNIRRVIFYIIVSSDRIATIKYTYYAINHFMYNIMGKAEFGEK
jgi:rhamnosyltransferase